jgi:hypothetical protein
MKKRTNTGVETTPEVVETTGDVAESINAVELAEAKAIIAEAKRIKEQPASANGKAEVFNGQTVYAIFTAEMHGAHEVAIGKDNKITGPNYIALAKLMAHDRGFEVRLS